MGLSDLTEGRVRQAIAECDRVGREPFLRTHGYKPAIKYVLLYDGREYDSKAIAGVACGMGPGELSGGAQTVEPALTKLGLTVIHADTHWYEDELVLVLHWYLRNRLHALAADDEHVVTLSHALEGLASARGRFATGRWRGPVQVLAQLDRFRALDPSNEQRRATEPSTLHDDVWTRHAEQLYTRTRTVNALLGEVEAVGSRVEERRITKYGTHTQASKPAEPMPSVSPEAMRAAYAGPRTPAPRTAAAPRVEDPAAWDQANESHEQLRDALAMWLRDNRFAIYDASTEARNRRLDYDLGAHRDELRLIIETKSMPSTGGSTAEAGRLRHGLGQVLWYRQRLRAECGERRVAVLAVERAPQEHQAWREVCAEAGVVLVWPDRFLDLIDECKALGARE